jgi:acyl-CoA thioesterase FadM
VTFRVLNDSEYSIDDERFSGVGSYLAEFDFRYSNRVRLGIDDVQRTEIAIKGIKGKRLTYRTTGRGETAEGRQG